MQDNFTSMDEQVQIMFRGIKESAFGVDFIEFLEGLSKENYQAWKNDASEFDQHHKGYAESVDFLLELFAECSKERQPIDTEETEINIPNVMD